MIITSCGNSEKVARELAKKLKTTYSPLTISAFPDGDTYLKFNTDLKGKKVVIVQSFQPSPEKSLLHVVFAGQTAQDLGAKKVILVAPYLAYTRQDARFHPGEAISSKIMGKLISVAFDRVITFDPHLHRYKSMKEVFSCDATKLSANTLIGKYIQKNIQNPVLVGPDGESSQWAAKIANTIGAESTVFEKKRYSSWKVRVEMVNPLPLKGRNVVIVDDIISTGKTMIEAVKLAQRHKAQSITAIGVHGIFVGDCYQKLKKMGVKIISTNCVKHVSNKIDVTPMLANELNGD